jgi:hypothetical protein
MMRRVFLLMVMFLSLFIFSIPHVALASWAKAFGTTGSDYGGVWPTDNGNYYLWLSSGSGAAEKLYLSQLNSSGVIQWTKTIDGPGEDDLSIEELADGSFFVSGTTKSFGTAGGWNILWAKFTSSFTPVYQKVFGGAQDESTKFTQTTDGGFIAAGTTNSYGFSTNDKDILVIKINASGEIQWSTVIHHGLDDARAGILEVSDGYLLTASVAGSITGVKDILVVKLNASGAIVWKKLYEGSGVKNVTAQKVTGGYLLLGSTKPVYTSEVDILLIKLNTSGDIQWQKQYDSGYSDIVHTVIESADGSLIVSGMISSPENAPDSANILLMGLTSTGGIVWQKELDGPGYDAASLKKRSDGSYLLSGISTSFNPPLYNNYDIFYAKLDSNLNFLWQKTFGGSGMDSGGIYEIANQYILTGSTASWGAGNTDAFGVFSLDAIGNFPGCQYIKDVNLTESIASLTEDNPSLTTTTPTLVERQAGTAMDISLTIGTAPLTENIICTGGTPTTHSISGTVTMNSFGLSGVTMTLSGSGSGVTSTDNSGNYIFSDLNNGTYTVTPSKPGYVFDPPSRQVTINDADVAGVSFAASVFLITSITQAWSSDNDITITWESAPGLSYDVYLKNTFPGSFTWVTEVDASGASTSWTDDGSWPGGTHPTSVQERYYKVSVNGTDSENIVGMYKITASQGMNLISLPLIPFSTTLKDVIGCQVTGAGNEGAADRIWVWNGTNYQFAWLVEGTGNPAYDGKWFTANSETTITLGADQGAWLQIRPGHGSQTVYLLGEVSSIDRTIPLSVGMNLVGTCYPVSVPLGDKLPIDSDLWESGATGATNEGSADRVWSWTGTNYQFHWLVEGAGPTYDGLWYTGNQQSTLQLEAGKGYWVQIREVHDPFIWVYPRPY